MKILALFFLLLLISCSPESVSTNTVCPCDLNGSWSHGPLEGTIITPQGSSILSTSSGFLTIAEDMGDFYFSVDNLDSTFLDYARVGTISLMGCDSAIFSGGEYAYFDEEGWEGGSLTLTYNAELLMCVFSEDCNEVSIVDGNNQTDFSRN